MSPQKIHTYNHLVVSSPLLSLVLTGARGRIGSVFAQNLVYLFWITQWNRFKKSSELLFISGYLHCKNIYFLSLVQIPHTPACVCCFLSCLFLLQEASGSISAFSHYMVANGNKVSPVSFLSSPQVCCAPSNTLPFLPFAGPHSNAPIPGAYLETQNETLHLECGLTSAEQRRTTSIRLAAAFLIILPRMQMAIFCFKGTLLALIQTVHQHPQFFSAVTFSLHGPTSLLLMWDSSKTQDFTFHFAELHEFNISNWE